MDSQEILKTITHEVVKEPIYYNQEGKDRLTKALLDTVPNLVLDSITSNSTDIGYSFSVQLRYE